MNWQNVVIDALIILSVTALAALDKIPSEAAIAVLGAMGGARVAQRNRDGKGKGPPTGAAAALVLGILPAFLSRRA
jgi:hypothetical protein